MKWLSPGEENDDREMEVREMEVREMEGVTIIFQEEGL